MKETDLHQPETDFEPELETQETPETTETAETWDSAEGKERIGAVRSWVGQKFGELANVLRKDAQLNEEMFEKLKPQIEANRRTRIEELNRRVLALLERTENVEKYYDEQLDELERLSALKAEEYVNISPEDFKNMPRMDKRVLVSEGLLGKIIEQTDDPEALIQWSGVSRAYERKYIDQIEEKIAKQAAKEYGEPNTREAWKLLSNPAYEKFKVMRGSSTDKDQAIYHREANEKMDKETAVQFFQWQFEDGNYNGDLRTLGNYMKYVPAEERDPELIALAKSVITEKYWSIHSGNEKYEDLVDQIEDVNSPVSKVLQALWAGEMGINPFTSRTDTLGKQIKLIERMREIVSDPERGQAYLDYFVKKCGITNLDRYPMSMLDGVYKDRDNKDKPFGLMVLARADENQAFSKDNETYDEFYKSLQANGQRLLLTEAGSDRELLAAIKNASTRQGKKIGFMLVGGHGSPDSIQLGEGEAIYRKTPKRRSEYEQDNDTHIRMTVRAARKYVEPGAEVLALSCSTGAKTDKYTFPIAESTARRTGWITKGFSRPLGFNNLKSHIKEDGRIGLTVDVHDGPLSLREREKFKGAPARVNTFHYENFRAESYDYLAKSGEK
jgi:hypothetical protein